MLTNGDDDEVSQTDRRNATAAIKVRPPDSSSFTSRRGAANFGCLSTATRQFAISHAHTQSRAGQLDRAHSHKPLSRQCISLWNPPLNLPSSPLHNDNQIQSDRIATRSRRRRERFATRRRQTSPSFRLEPRTIDRLRWSILNISSKIKKIKSLKNHTLKKSLAKLLKKITHDRERSLNSRAHKPPQ